MFASYFLPHFISIKTSFSNLNIFFPSPSQITAEKSTQSLNNSKKKQPLSLAQLSVPTFEEAGKDLRCGFLLTGEGLLDISHRSTVPWLLIPRPAALSGRGEAWPLVTFTELTARGGENHRIHRERNNYATTPITGIPFDHLNNLHATQTHT